MEEQNEKLVALFYILMRDYVHVGDMTKIVIDLEQVINTFEFSNKFLEDYSRNLLERLT